MPFTEIMGVSSLLVGLLPEINLKDVASYFFLIFSAIGGLYAYLQFNKKEKPQITFDYMRLFGAIEVPLIMRIISKKYKFKKLPEKYGRKYYKLAEDFEGGQQIISKDLYKFWKKKWFYKNALPIKNDLWEYCIEKNRHAKNIYFTFAGNSQHEILDFSKNVNIDGAGCLGSQVEEKISTKLQQKNYKNNCFGSAGAGYLFLIISNTGKKTISDITLEYKTYNTGGEIKEYSISALNTLISNAEFSERNYDVPKRTLKDYSFEINSKEISSLAPGDSLIWILGIYTRNTDGFPQNYITPMIEPLSMRFLCDGDKMHQKIRKPSEEKAIKIDIPDGWFKQ